MVSVSDILLDFRDRVVVKKMDLISGLPITILHDILIRLPEKDVVRNSVLSKAWKEIWSTFPKLSICDTQVIWTFPMEGDFLSKRKIFVEYVKKTLLWFCNQGLAIKEFTLHLDYFEPLYPKL